MPTLPEEDAAAEVNGLADADPPPGVERAVCVGVPSSRVVITIRGRVRVRVRKGEGWG